MRNKVAAALNKITQMKKAIIATFVFLAMQAIVPAVGTYLVTVFGQKAGVAVDVAAATLSPAVIAVELLFSYLLTVGALYAWRMLSPVSGLAVRCKAMPVALVLMLLFIVAANVINELLDLPDMAADKLPPLMRNPLCVACIALFGPVVEELVFRRVAIGSLLEGGYRPMTAIAVSAALFAVVHINPAQMPVAFIMGLLLGWFYVRTGSVVVPVVCHVLNNSLGVLLFHLFPDAKLVPCFGGNAGALLVLAVCAAGSVLLVRLYARLTRCGVSEKEQANVKEI